MKQYVMKYALLIVVTTGLLNASSRPEPLVMVRPQQRTFPIKFIKDESVTGKVFGAYAPVKWGILTRGAYHGEITESTEYQGRPDTAARIFVSKDEAELEKLAQGTRIVSVLRNRNIQSKAVPQNCEGTMVYNVSQGKSGNLKLTRDESSNVTCSQTLAEYAMTSMQERASRAWEATTRNAGAAWHATRESARKAGQAAGRGLQRMHDTWDTTTRKIGEAATSASQSIQHGLGRARRTFSRTSAAAQQALQEPEVLVSEEQYE